MDAIIQGTVQGLTEFLPVSSSGHLELLSKLFGMRGDLPFVAFLHLGTFFAVFIFTFKHILKVLRSFKLLSLLFVSTIPAVLVGVLFEDLIEKIFNPSVLPYSFTITAALLVIGSSQRGKKRMEEMDVWDALLIGVAQAIAIIPGISRSGSTIAAALILGYSPEDSLYYSFLMSLPVTFGAGILKFQGAGASALVGLTFSFLFGLLALFLIRFSIIKDKFHVFSYYLLSIAALSFFTGG